MEGLKELQRWLIYACIGLAIIVTAFGVGAWFSPAFREFSRDMAIVVLALFQMVATLLVIVLIVAVLYTIRSIHRMTQQSIVPKVDNITVKVDALTAKVDALTDNAHSVVTSVREVSDTVATTTVFTAERVVSPIITVSGLVAGVRAAASALARRDVHTQDRATDSAYLEDRPAESSRDE